MCVAMDGRVISNFEMNFYEIYITDVFVFSFQVRSMESHSARIAIQSLGENWSHKTTQRAK